MKYERAVYKENLTELLHYVFPQIPYHELEDGVGMPPPGAVSAFLDRHNIDPNEMELSDEQQLSTGFKWEGYPPLMRIFIPRRGRRGDMYPSFVLARALLARGADVNGMSDFGSTPLIKALRFGAVAVATLYLENGADVNLAEERKYRETPLVCAISNLNKPSGGLPVRLVEELIARGADVNTPTGLGWTPLVKAAMLASDAPSDAER